MARLILQAYDHALNVVRGWNPPTHLQKVAPVDTALLQTISTWPAGRVGFVSGSGANAGTVTLATPTNTAGNPMPLYLLQGGQGYDVADTGVNAAGNLVQVNTAPGGVITGLVATGGFELQTTEYKTGQGVNYSVNTPLTVALDASNIGGLLAPGTFYTNWICGVASVHWGYDYQTYGPGQYPTSPVGVNAMKRNVLTFWSYFLPKSGS